MRNRTCKHHWLFSLKCFVIDKGGDAFSRRPVAWLAVECHQFGVVGIVRRANAQENGIADVTALEDRRLRRLRRQRLRRRWFRRRRQHFTEILAGLQTKGTDGAALLRRHRGTGTSDRQAAAAAASDGGDVDADDRNDTDASGPGRIEWHRWRLSAQLGSLLF